MLSPEQIKLLADQYLKGTISDADRERFDAWYESMPDSIDWKGDEHESAFSLRNTMYVDLLEKISRDETPVVPMRKPWLRIAVAAAVLVVLAAGAWLWREPAAQKEQRQPVVKEEKAPDILPGGNKATLTLADGSQLVLDSMQNGVIAQQGNTSVNKQAALLDYRQSTKAPVSPGIVYNTLTTPRGGKFQLILPDGTKVWLNAASSLRFPASFTGKKREVEVTGEAFFEVAEDPAKPFIVQAAKQQLQVLGTNFNVNVYADEAMPATTLISGSLKVASGGESILLKPGQQSVFDPAGGKAAFRLQPCIIADVTAWKKDRFSFTETALPVVMRQLARWYNLEVRYEGDLPTSKFNGTFSREYTLSEVIRILKISNVNLKLDGNTVIIQP